jgi:plastocyanin
VNRRRTLAALLLALAALLASAVGAKSLPTPRLEVSQLPDDPSQPYGITAIDYHFHDAHPTLPLSPARTVVWVNEGRNLHNVTIPAIDFSKDLPVGSTITIDALGEKLGGPGTYTFYCKYHANRGMSGVIVIA